VIQTSKNIFSNLPRSLECKVAGSLPYYEGNQCRFKSTALAQPVDCIKLPGLTTQATTSQSAACCTVSTRRCEIVSGAMQAYIVLLISWNFSRF